MEYAGHFVDLEMEQTPDPKQIAAQLKCPSGDDGLIAAQHMNQNNAGIIRETLQRLQPPAVAQLLEIGPGNASHLPQVLALAPGLQYTGADISATMVEQARSLNAGLQQQAAFLLVDGVHLPFDDGRFSRIFTVNTFYFWANPTEQLAEIKRVLQPGGRFILSMGSKRFMENLPFTAFEFKLYNEPEVQALLEGQGFTVEQTEFYFEPGPNGMRKEFMIFTITR